jgi:c-di-AMP phosphodiesterase-like protein
MKKHFKRWNLPEAKIYLAIILFLAIILIQFDYWIGGMAVVLFLFLLYYNRRMIRQRGEEWSSYLENLSEDIEWATKNAVSSIPMPLVVIETGGSITWYNPLFGELFQGERLLERNIHDLVPELIPSRFQSDKDGNVQELFFRDRWYRLLWTPVKTGSGNRKGKIIFLIYWLDITEEHRIKELYQAKKIAVAHIMVDNYDELLANTENTKRPAVLAAIESGIANWASDIHAGWIKYDREKYMVVMEEKELEAVRQKKFDVLDEVREIDEGNKIAPTLSIGVGMDAENPAQSSISALSALELAWGGAVTRQW